MTDPAIPEPDLTPMGSWHLYDLETGEQTGYIGPVTWHLLVCLDCTKAEVFDTPGERDGWQQAHTESTGHQRWIVKDQPRTRRDGEGS